MLFFFSLQKNYFIILNTNFNFLSTLTFIIQFLNISSVLNEHYQNNTHLSPLNYFYYLFNIRHSFIHILYITIKTSKQTNNHHIQMEKQHNSVRFSLVHLKANQHSTLHPLSSPSLSSHRIRSRYLIVVSSDYITSYPILSYPITSHHTTPHHTTSHHITSHHITSHHINHITSPLQYALSSERGVEHRALLCTRLWQKHRVDEKTAVNLTTLKKEGIRKKEEQV